MMNYGITIQLKQSLMEMSALTDRLSGNPGAFAQACTEYMIGLKNLAEQHNLYIASDVSMNLNKILTFQSDAKNAAGAIRHNLRKDKDAYAVKCLEELHSGIKKFLERDLNTFDECCNIWRQVLSRAMAKGYDFSQFGTPEKLDVVMTAVKEDQELLPYFSHIAGLIGIYNAKALLDITLPQLGL